MKTPPKKEADNRDLQNTQTKTENEIDVTLLKNAGQKQRTDIRNLPYSKDKDDTIYLFRTSLPHGKQGVKQSAPPKKNVEDYDELLNRTAPILRRLRNYSTRYSNNKLSTTEMETLNGLLIKVFAPSAASVGLHTDTGLELESVETFENLSESSFSSTFESMKKIWADVTITLGMALGFFLFHNKIQEGNEEFFDDFYAENNLPPMLFDKKNVLIHVYFTELLLQGCNPLQLILSVDELITLVEKSRHEIIASAKVMMRQLEKEAKEAEES
jgi:hypothetical protein